MKRKEAFSQRYQIRSACARCHRLKSKCVYEDPDFVSCKRCFDLGIKCSTDEDPTAKRIRKRQNPSRLVRLLGELDKELARVRGNGGEGNGNGNEGKGNGGEGNGNEGRENEGKENGIGIEEKGNGIGIEEKGNKGKGIEGIEDKEEGKGIPHRETVSRLFASVLDHAEHLGLSQNLANVLPHDSRSRYTYFLVHMRPSYPILMIPSRFSDYDVCLKESPELLSACIYVTTIHHHAGLQEQSNQSNHGKIQNSFGNQSNSYGNQSLKSYIDKTLAQLVFVQANDFSSNLVTTLIVLSLWNLPAGKPGHFKSHMDLLIAYSVSICIDISADSDLDMLRSFVSVFCCCGSLSLSLSRFRFVSWSKKLSLAVQILSNTLVAEDTFLCGYSRMIVEGLKLMDFFNDVSLSANSVASEKELADALPSFHETTPLPVVLGRISDSQDILCLENPYSFDKSLTGLSQYAPRCLVLVSYHQIMTMAYEHALGLCIFHVQMHQMQKTPSDYSATMTDLISRIEDSSSMILACVVHVWETGCLSDFPTLIYYRVLSALMVLVRVSIVVKSDIVKNHMGISIGFDLLGFYKKVVEVFELGEISFSEEVDEKVQTTQFTEGEESEKVQTTQFTEEEESQKVRSQKFKSQSRSQNMSPVQERFSVILKKIKAWILAIENNTVGLSAIKVSLPKGKEVEYLKTPSGRYEAKEEGNERNQDFFPNLGPSLQSHYEVVSDSTIHGIFKELEDDIERFLDPFNDNPFRTDELFGFE